MCACVCVKNRARCLTLPARGASTSIGASRSLGAGERGVVPRECWIVGAGAWGTSSGGGIGAGGSGERRVRGGCGAFSEEAPSFGIGAGHAARHAEEAQGRHKPCGQAMRSTRKA